MADHCCPQLVLKSRTLPPCVRSVEQPAGPGATATEHRARPATSDQLRQVRIHRAGRRSRRLRREDWRSKNRPSLPWLLSSAQEDPPRNSTRALDKRIAGVVTHHDALQSKLSVCCGERDRLGSEGNKTMQARIVRNDVSASLPASRDCEDFDRGLCSPSLMWTVFPRASASRRTSASCQAPSAMSSHAKTR